MKLKDLKNQIEEFPDEYDYLELRFFSENLGQYDYLQFKLAHDTGKPEGERKFIYVNNIKKRDNNGK